jgi:predicted permease
MLPRAASWIVRAVVPAHRVKTVIADLDEDYAKHPSAVWLAKETASLVASYLAARATRAPRYFAVLLRDCHIVARGFRRGTAPLLAAAALLAVGLTAVQLTSGLVAQLLLRQVSAVHGDELRRIVAADRQGHLFSRFSYPELQQIREHLVHAGETAAVYLTPVVVRHGNTDVQTMAEIVDGRYFALTGTTPVLGRVLITGDDRADAPPVTVLAEPFWRQQLDASPHVIGTTLRLNGASYTVVGIAAAGGSSSFFGASVDAWVTLSHADPIVNAGWRTNVRDRWFTAFVLPRAGLPAVETHLAVASEQLSRVYGESWRERRLQTTEATVTIGSQRAAATMLTLILSALTTLIMLAAGANVSGVLMARAAANQRIAAIHISIGAGRLVVLRRQLIEGACLGFAAGLFSLGLYHWVRTQLAEVVLLPTLALRLDLPLSLSTVAVSILGSAAAGMVLAIAPAVWSTRVDLTQALRDGNARAAGQGIALRARRALVSAQVGVSVVLLVGAVLFVRSFAALADADLGFSRERLVAMDFDVQPVTRTADEMPALARDALARVSALPQIAAAAMSNRAPVDQSTPTVDVQLPGDAASRVTEVTMYLATDRYFETVGVPIVRGRGFTKNDLAIGADVVLINESLASRLWPGGEALDRAIRLSIDDRTRRVVGVTRNSRYRTLTESFAPHVYVPTPPALDLTLLARTTSDPREALRTIQKELDQVGPGLVGFFPRTMDDHLAVQLLPMRAAAQAASLLGVVALLLSGVALYALVAWFVVLRRREIGVRMALGASGRDVRILVARQAIAAAAPGVAAGLGMSVGLGWLAQSALHGVGAADPLALGIGIGTVALVVLVAGYFPTRAATAVDPATALRQ